MGPMTMPKLVVLRDYQEDAVEKIRAAFKECRRVLFVLSTGGGKTVIFSFIAASAADLKRRVVIVAHRREIVDQISDALTLFGVQHGLIMPNRTPTEDPVQVGMVQTLYNRIAKGKIAPPDLLVVDEAHHSVAGSWRRVMKAWPRTRVLGVSATPERLDGKGLGGVFDIMVTGPTMRWLIENEYLARFDYLAPPSVIDLSDVHTRGGDYAVNELADAMMQSTICGDAERHYRNYLNGRPAIVFCVTRAHAQQVANQFAAAGWKAASIDGTMSPHVRKDLIKSLADGRLNVLTSCELISEGVDVKVCAGAILLRPTQSLALYLQQIGRALRAKADGSMAIILDHVGNVHRFGMPDFEREWSLEGKTKRKKAEDVTTCKLCYKTFPKEQAKSLTEMCLGVDCDPCPYQDERESKKELPSIVDGELKKVTDIRPSDPTRPEWAGGMAIDRSSSGRAWYRLLELADTQDKLREIAAARGYKSGWVQHAMRARAETKAGVDAILNGSKDYNNDSSTWENATENILWGVIRAVEAAESWPEGYPHYWPTVAQYARDELRRRRRSAAA
jgi:DNA repair protein RadD